MFGLRRLGLAMLCAAAPGFAAHAQTPTLVGVWSWRSPGLHGTDTNSLALNPDGSYVRAALIADGTVIRSWGHYETVQIAPYQMRLRYSADGWLPTQMCAVVPGMMRNCQPAPAPEALDTVVTFTSPTSLSAAGATLLRDPDSAVLRMQAQAVVTTVVAQPAALNMQSPTMRSPTMPQMHPYTTPNGPGNRAADAYHQQNQNFINGHMRGCVQDHYGRWVGCEQ